MDWIIRYNILEKLSEKDFEDLLECFFKESGLKVLEKRQGKGSDGGYDYLLEFSSVFLKFTIVTQIKKYNPRKSVTVTQIREFHSVIEQNNFNFGWYITTSKFTNPAIDEANRINNLQITDSAQLLTIFNNTDETKKKMASLIRSKMETDPVFNLNQIKEIISLIPKKDELKFMSALVDTTINKIIELFQLKEIYQKINIIEEVQFSLFYGYEPIGPHNVGYLYGSTNYEEEKVWWKTKMVPILNELANHDILAKDSCDPPCYFIPHDMFKLSGRLDLLISILKYKLGLTK